MKYYHIEIESPLGLRTATKSTAQKILKNTLGIKPSVLKVRAENMTRYHRRRSLIMGLSDRASGLMEDVFTVGGATPLPLRVTLTYADKELMIDTKSWTMEFNDGRNRGSAQPREAENYEDVFGEEG
jgi:hypothetical protein